MDYKFLTSLSDTTWIVEEVASGEQYVTKKIECMDEMEANKFFHKMVLYQKLKHPYLVPCRHLFIMWDDEEFSVCLNVVSSYYQKGSLAQFLMNKRKNKEWLGKTQLKKWIGQIIEVMECMHRQNSYHKRLNSTNVFITDDDNVAIGDYPPTLRSSIKPGSINWFPPEIVDETSCCDLNYDERSDIWSAGCVVLEMATTGCLSDTGFFSLLYQLKVNPDLLVEVLPKIEDEYGSEVSDIIKVMCRVNYHQRPLAIDLCYTPLVKECMMLYESKLLQELNSLKDEQEIISIQLYRAKYSISKQCDILDQLIKLLSDNSLSLLTSLQTLLINSAIKHSHPDYISKVLHVLHLGSDYELLKQCSSYPAIMSLATALLEHTHIPTIKSSLQFLFDLSSEDTHDINNKLLSVGVLGKTLKLARSHNTEPGILEITFKLLRNITRPRSVLNGAVSGGMVDTIMSTLLHHAESAPLAKAGLDLLWSAHDSSDVVITLTSTNSNIHLFIRLLALHIEDAVIILLVIQLLIVLCNIKGVGVMSVAAGKGRRLPLLSMLCYTCVELALGLLNGCILFDVSDELYYVLSDLKLSPTGVTIIINILKYQSDHDEVMKEVLLLINNMTKHVDIKEEMVQCGLKEALSNYSNSTWNKGLRDSVHELLKSLAENEY